MPSGETTSTGLLHGLLADPAGLLLRVLLCGALGTALGGMPLAMLGVFRPIPVLIAALAGFVALWSLWGPVRLGAAGARAPGVAALVLIAVVTGVNAKYQAQHVIAESDPGVYTVTGRFLAGEGTLRIDNSARAFGYDNELVFGGKGFYSRAEHPHYLQPQFLHLLPALLAIATGWAALSCSSRRPR
jgi:hypothetical protein